MSDSPQRETSRPYAELREAANESADFVGSPTRAEKRVYFIDETDFLPDIEFSDLEEGTENGDRILREAWVHKNSAYT